MMKYLLLALLIFSINVPCFADDYNVYTPDNFQVSTVDEEKILFILDFSNSMNEYLENDRKIDLMIKTMRNILPTINVNTILGLRVYGHRVSFTPYDSCRASSLVVPLSKSNSNVINSKLSNLSPKGMTPITYSLKEAIKKDFLGIKGKKRIILLTDGGENCDESPCDFVMELIKTRRDINIDVIAFNISNKDDIDQLKCTALVTRGKFYNAETNAELINSLNDSLSIKKNVEAKLILNE